MDSFERRLPRSCTDATDHKQQTAADDGPPLGLVSLRERRWERGLDIYSGLPLQGEERADWQTWKREQLANNAKHERTLMEKVLRAI